MCKNRRFQRHHGRPPSYSRSNLFGDFKILVELFVPGANGVDSHMTGVVPSQDEPGSIPGKTAQERHGWMGGSSSGGSPVHRRGVL